MKKVLIAHQSTIPHYRVPFYNALEQYKSDDWCFDVVFDPSELDNKIFFREELNPNSFKFSILPVNTIPLKIAGTKICYQTFWKKAAEYDLVVIEQALNNLTYPLCHLHQLKGIKLMYWGHGKHQKIQKPSLFRSLSEQAKLFLTNQANGFFAYTPGVKSFLIEKGFPANQIFVLNNTVDINIQRQAFEKLKTQRTEIRRSLNLTDQKVLLFVGRFGNTKRVDFLLKAFSIMQQKDNSFHLLMVGTGGENYLQDKPENVSYFGSIIDLDKIASIYVAADVFSFPGSVGLGPLQALCYNLPVVTIDSHVQSPEIEYLSPQNSLILSSDTTPEEYAKSIIELFAEPQKLACLQNSTWSTIKDLTIEQMAKNFAMGVKNILS